MALTQNPSFTGLNDHLIAKFFPLKRSGDGAAFERDDAGGEVSAPLTQASMDLAMTWQSPFEGAGVESRFPGLAQMAQAGMFSGVLNAIKSHVKPESLTAEFIDGVNKSASQLGGRSGVTKLNSTQVFSGMPPVKIQVTAFFKAFSDPQREVEDPIRTLQEWVLPQELAPDGVMAEFIRTGNVLSLMPSKVPLCIGFIYKNRIFSPMVVESVSDPLDAPIDDRGRRISCAVQLTLCSLTALDRKDWGNTYKAL